MARHQAQAGGRVLRAVSRTAAMHMRRPADLAARYGGEELALLLPNTDAEQARHVVDGICQAIAEQAIPHAASAAAPMLTVSAGGATCASAGNETGNQLLEAADNHLYQAKQAGRNRVIWREACIA